MSHHSIEPESVVDQWVSSHEALINRGCPGANLTLRLGFSYLMNISCEMWLHESRTELAADC